MEAATAPQTSALSLQDAAVALAAAGAAKSRRGRDAQLVARVAEIPQAAWGSAVEREVRAIADRSRFELLAAGVDVDALPAPAGGEDLEHGPVWVRSVFCRGDRVVVAFTFDEALHQAMLELPERAYERARKEWTLPQTRESAEALFALLTEHVAFTVEPQTAVLLRRLLSGEDVGRPARYAEPDPHGRGWRIVLAPPATPRERAIVDAVKALSQSRFFAARRGESAYWRIDTRKPGVMDELAAFLADHPEIHLDHQARTALPDATVTVSIDVDDLAAREVGETPPADRWVKANVKTFTVDVARDAAVRAGAMQIHGAELDTDSGRVRVPRLPLTAPALLDLIDRHDLWTAGETRSTLERLAAEEQLRARHAARLPELSRAKEIPAHLVENALRGLGGELHPFQRVPVVFPRLGVRNIWIADSMGLGKTPEALATVYGERATPCVVVCPKSHTLNWARTEIPTWIPNANVVVLRGKTPDAAALDGADFAVIQHDLIADWLDTLRGRFAAFICDESHNFANAGRRGKDGAIKGTKRTYAVSELAADVRSRQGLVLLLTGTPKKNGRNVELIPQLEILGELERVCAPLNDPPTLDRVQRPVQRYLHWFCLPPDAPVLMADMTERSIADVRPGESVVGWAASPEGRRRLVETRVLNVHVRSGQPLQRVTMSDGSELICTPDHRWFNGSAPYFGEERMYQPARTGTPGGTGIAAPSRIVKVCGRLQGPHLGTADHDRGYVYGLFCGDGYASRTSRTVEHLLKGSKTTGIVGHTVGLGSCDVESIDRAERILHGRGVPFTRRIELAKKAQHRDMHRLELSNAAGYAFFAEEQPDTDAWWAGFLAGIYDAEGSASVIYQSKDYNPRIYALIEQALERCEIPYRRGRNDREFRILGGRAGLMRFWVMTNPALTRKLQKLMFLRGGQFMEDRPYVESIEPLPGLHEVWTLTTETGNYVAYGFASKNCDPQPDDFAASGYRFDGSSHDQALHDLLRATCYIRRHKREVLEQLPAKQRPLVPLELTASQLGDYKRAQRDIVAFLREHHGGRAETAALLEGLSRERARQIAADVATKAGRAAQRAPGLVEMNTLRRLLAQAKLPAVIDWTRQFLTGDEKLVLFAVHKDIQTALVDAFPGCAHIISGDSTETIEVEKARFQEDPACQLIVCSLGIAKEGHTLTAASHVAFCELDWAPLALEQAEDRVYGRMNDLHGATCHYLLGVGPEQWGEEFRTIDEVMAARIDRKRRSNAATTDGDAGEQLMGESILNEVLEAMTGAGA